MSPRQEFTLSLSYANKNIPGIDCIYLYTKKLEKWLLNNAADLTPHEEWQKLTEYRLTVPDFVVTVASLNLFRHCLKLFLSKSSFLLSVP